MQRLLQGDVGSGKTVVALYALLRAVEAGRQGALMAPTETLAEQHFLTVEGICRELGVRCVLLTSSLPAKEHAAARAAIARGEAQVAVGTHALIQERSSSPTSPSPSSTSSTASGSSSGTRSPRAARRTSLHMTATPIPRTLALTVYGDLAVSEIAKPPADRKPIVTRWITEERARRRTRGCARYLARGPAGVRRLPADRGVGDEPSRARPSRRPSGCGRGELRGFRVGCLHGRLRPGRPARR